MKKRGGLRLRQAKTRARPWIGGHGFNDVLEETRRIQKLIDETSEKVDPGMLEA
jgi:hypothetical protein